MIYSIKILNLIFIVVDDKNRREEGNDGSHSGNMHRGARKRNQIKSGLRNNK